jgi:hypothetical protein
MQQAFEVGEFGDQADDGRAVARLGAAKAVGGGGGAHALILHSL